MQYLSFRAIFASVTSLLIAVFIGKRIIRWLQKKQIGEEIRDLGLEGQMQKKGTPTMGGIIIRPHQHIHHTAHHKYSMVRFLRICG